MIINNPNYLIIILYSFISTVGIVAVYYDIFGMRIPNSYWDLLIRDFPRDIPTQSEATALKVYLSTAHIFLRATVLLLITKFNYV